jgi:broad specificity phosphatase PhoE
VQTLILIKHSLPEIVGGLPPCEWQLSDAGRDRCRALAERITPHRPTRLVASRELKAYETAEQVAAQLKLPLTAEDNLHEHVQSETQLLPPAEFAAAVARLFAHPGDLVFGSETADQAHRRFAQALGENLARNGTETVAVVTHGRVLTLFVTRALGLDPFPFWKRLGLPSFVVMAWPHPRLLTLVDRVESA